jgi:hypothetical protein
MTVKVNPAKFGNNFRFDSRDIDITWKNTEINL